MKTITIFSDTHGNKTLLKKCQQICNECDLILHAGDGNCDVFSIDGAYEKAIIVDGNCDGGFAGCHEQIIEIEQKRILLTHGHLFGVKTSLKTLVAYAKSKECNVVIYGHNHKMRVEEIDGVLTINPGTLSRTSAYKSFCYLVINQSKAVATLREIYQQKKV